MGVRVHGGASRNRDKKAFRVYFREEYGPKKLEYPLFGPDASDEIDAIVLSGGSAFGLDACGGVMSGLRTDGRGFAVAQDGLSRFWGDALQRFKMVAENTPHD